MKSQNAPFNEFGQSMILRDIETLYQRASALKKDAEALAQVLGGANPFPQYLLASSYTTPFSIQYVRVQSPAALTLGPGSAQGTFTTYAATDATSTLSGMNATTGTFTTPVDGLYQISGGAVVTANGETGGFIEAFVSFGGSASLNPSASGTQMQSTGAARLICYPTISTVSYLLTGQTITLRAAVQQNGASSGSGSGGVLCIVRLV